MMAQATDQRHAPVADACRRCGIDVPVGRALCGDCQGFDPEAVYARSVLANRRRVAAWYRRNRERALAKQRLRNAERAEAQRERRLSRDAPHRTSCRCATCAARTAA